MVWAAKEEEEAPDQNRWDCESDEGRIVKDFDLLESLSEACFFVLGLGYGYGLAWIRLGASDSGDRPLTSDRERLAIQGGSAGCWGF